MSKISKTPNFYFVLDAASKSGLQIANINQFNIINYQTQIFPDTSRQYKFDEISKIEKNDIALLYYQFTKPFDACVTRVLRLKKYLQNYFKNITLIAPFMPFLREHQDAKHTNSCFLFDDLNIITIDAHISWPNIISLQPEIIKSFINPNDLIILPDFGARRYINWMKNEYVRAKKDRKTGLVIDDAEKIEGRNCVILDDILDTGYTLNNTVKFLKFYGAKSIKAYITHYLGNFEPLSLCQDFKGLDSLHIYDTVLEESRKMLMENVDNVIIHDHTKAFSDLKEKLCILTNLN